MERMSEPTRFRHFSDRAFMPWQASLTSARVDEWRRGPTDPPGQRFTRASSGSSSSVRADSRSSLKPPTGAECRQVAGPVLVRVRVAPQVTVGNTASVHIGYTCERKTAADVGQRCATFAQVSRRFSGRPAQHRPGGTRCRSTARTRADADAAAAARSRSRACTRSRSRSGPR